MRSEIRNPRLGLPVCAAVTLGLLAIGCEDSQPGHGGPNGHGPHGHGNVTAEALKPPGPGKGVQLRMTSVIGAGEEVERCMFYTVPAGGLNVNSETTKYTAGSHHCILYRTGYTSIPTVDKKGAARSL